MKHFKLLLEVELIVKKFAQQVIQDSIEALR